VEQTRLDLEDQLHARLSVQLEEEIETGGLIGVPEREALRTRVSHLVEDLPAVLTRSDVERLVQAVIDRVLGLGPLEPLLADPTITEIMVNDPTHVFIEREGRIESCAVRFRDEAHLRHVIDRIVAPLGRRIDESSPLVDARLPDGSRVNAIIPPLALGGPVLTIRKFSRRPFVGSAGGAQTCGLSWPAH
jgi:pilus assembly protein CpaF